MKKIYGLIDFMKNKESIKEEYKTMNLEEKILFKKEIYSLCFENEYVKDCMWEFLNCTDDELLMCNIRLANERRKRRV